MYLPSECSHDDLCVIAVVASCKKLNVDQMGGSQTKRGLGRTELKTC